MEKAGMKQNNKKIVITGSIASGKSTVSEYIRNKGYKVIDSDSFAKEILKSDEIDLKIKDKFGFSSQSVDFKREVFKNKELRDFIEENVYLILYTAYKNMEEEILFFEIPLYFESINSAKLSGFEPDIVLYVSADREIRHLRMKKYRNMTDEEIHSREKHFLDEELKISQSDFVIFNNGDTNKLYLDTERFLDENVKKTD